MHIYNIERSGEFLGQSTTLFERPFSLTSHIFMNEFVPRRKKQWGWRFGSVVEKPEKQAARWILCTRWWHESAQAGLVLDFKSMVCCIHNIFIMSFRIFGSSCFNIFVKEVSKTFNIMRSVRRNYSERISKAWEQIMAIMWGTIITWRRRRKLVDQNWSTNLWNHIELFYEFSAIHRFFLKLKSKSKSKSWQP